MLRTTRNILFFFFAAVFLVSAPLLVLYTAGYRISLNNYRVIETGAIAVSTNPHGASITVDTKVEPNKSPTVIQNVLPQTLPIRLTKNGYIPWEESIQVSGGQTTYVNATLYADAQPEMLATFPKHALTVQSPNARYLIVLTDTGGQTQVSLYDVIVKEQKNLTTLPGAAAGYAVAFSSDTNIFAVTQKGIPVVGFTYNGGNVNRDSLSTILTGSSGVMLTNNGNNVEVRSSKNGDTLLALLPEGTYDVLTADEDFVILRDAKKMITVVSLSGSDVVTLDVPGELWDWLPDAHMLTWSDGIEINVYDAQTKARTFLTRQSELIQNLMWHPEGGAVIFSTASGVTALDLEEHESRVSTLLLTPQGILTAAWIDKSGKNLYAVETVAGVPTLYRRKLLL